MEEQNYQIEIGEVYDIVEQAKVPKQKIIITQSQLAIIEMFANIERDEDLNCVYTLNSCRFKINPVINFK